MVYIFFSQLVSSINKGGSVTWRVLAKSRYSSCSFGKRKKTPGKISQLRLDMECFLKSHLFGRECGLIEGKMAKNGCLRRGRTVAVA